MDRQLISLTVAILLICLCVGPSTAVYDEEFNEIEANLAPLIGSESLAPENFYELPNATCWARGDVRYKTFDDLHFSYNTPVQTISLPVVTKFGIMVMPWKGNYWWVVTEQELFNGGPKTRIKRVYVRCSGEFFEADLGSTVTLRNRVTGVITETPFVYAGGLVTGDSLEPRGYIIRCHEVPMTVIVYLHTDEIEMTGKHCASALGVRGICGDYNGDAANDYDDLNPPDPPGLPAWEPFLVPERP